MKGSAESNSLILMPTARWTKMTNEQSHFNVSTWLCVQVMFEVSRRLTERSEFVTCLLLLMTFVAIRRLSDVRTCTMHYCPLTHSKMTQCCESKTRYKSFSFFFSLSMFQIFFFFIVFCHYCVMIIVSIWINFSLVYLLFLSRFFILFVVLHVFHMISALACRWMYWFYTYFASREM